ncbi:MAG: FMN-binding protein [Clostridia bacterium]|nr:FMN-binding protein [Clostridia bacterium]
MLLVAAAGCSNAPQQSAEPTSAPETAVVLPAEESNVELIDDNTASAVAEGFGGEITVTLKVEDGVITDCIVDGPDETDGVGSNAVEQLPGKIVEANSVEVDGISGCTFSSNAILEAAQLAYDAVVNK